MMERWIDSINNILNGHEVGKCPFCNSGDTDYRMIQMVKNSGTADIWCNQCRKSIHLSRIKVDDNMIKEADLPGFFKC